MRSDKISSTSSDKNQFKTQKVQTFDEEKKYSEDSKTNPEVRIAQIEANLAALKERLDNERNLKLWIIGTVLAIAAGIIGGFTIYISLIHDSQESYRNLQKDYYQSLMNFREEVIKQNQNKLENP